MKANESDGNGTEAGKNCKDREGKEKFLNLHNADGKPMKDRKGWCSSMREITRQTEKQTERQSKSDKDRERVRESERE